jgi:4-amino-4-deoxy-L-arabinose transferase-like glycosyltransferase
MSKKFNHKTILLLIILAAAAVRIIGLGSCPPALFRDEIDKVYNAYCILKTGHDLDGNLLPFFIRTFKVYITGAYHYLCIPFLAVFGLGPYATRLPAALAGLLTVYLTYGLVKSCFNQRAALLAAAALAMSPWHILFSRWANQGILLPLTLTGAIWALVIAHRRESKLYGIISTVLFAFSVYTYDIAKAFVPLLLIGLAVIGFRHWKKDWKTYLPGVVIAAIILIPIIYFTSFDSARSQARFTAISIFSLSSSPFVWVKLFIINYLKQWNPAFLFINGDPLPRHSLPGLGQMYIIDAIALAAGIFYFIKYRTKTSLIMLLWLLLYPVPAALTNPDQLPHSLRGICGLPTFAIAIGCGLDYIWTRLAALNQQRALKTALYSAIAIYTISVLIFLYTLFVLYPKDAALYWEKDWAEACQLAEDQKDNYDSIIITPHYRNFIEIMLLYYGKYDPKTAQSGQALEKYVLLEKWPPDYDLTLIKRRHLYLSYIHETIRLEKPVKLIQDWSDLQTEENATYLTAVEKTESAVKNETAE